MPARRSDAHRALELLEEYHSQLIRPGERPLRSAIERVIRIFKSRLFQALLDLQEFYELTLLDESKTTQQKTVETLQIASRWELEPPIVASVLQTQPSAESTDEPLPSPPPEMLPAEATPPAEPIYQRPNKARCEQPAMSACGQPLSMSKSIQQQLLVACSGPASEHTASSPSCATDEVYQTLSLADTASPQQTNGSSRWEYEEITLERGDAGLGFSIAGGTDNATAGGNTGIYITKLIEGGAALCDGRLRLNDTIVSVNGISTENVMHAQAVDALKKAGRTVILLVKRLRNLSETVMRIELLKGDKGLGFSIAGGIGNQHVQGDNGIFITKIIEGGAAHQDGRLMAGDRLISVNDINMENTVHEIAVATLKAAKDRVVLIVAKPSADSSPLHNLSNVNREDSFESVPQRPQMMSQMTLHRAVTSPIQMPASQQIATLPKVALDNNVTRAPRNVLLKKSSAGFGFNIVGGEDNEGIFVSFILGGGPADLGGDLRRGDQLLSVNGIDLRDATHEQAATVLKSAGDTVEILAQYMPEDYARFEAKIRDLREQLLQQQTTTITTGNGGSAIQSSQATGRFVRALFDYDPSHDAGLPGRGLEFKYGHVLNVVGDEDADWWHAVRVMPDDGASGVVPSKVRIERRERAHLQTIRQHGKSPDRKGTLEKKKKTLLSQKLPFVRSKSRGWSEDAFSSEDGGEDVIASYENVVQRELKSTRPVVILGPLKDRINDDLIAEFPDKFGSCVPHTTRPRRDYEVDGRDYHFTTRDQMERDIENHMFIEAGQYCDNLYGTSIQSVKEVANQGKHCILDVSGSAIKRLQAAGLYPIAVFIKPKSVEMIMQWNRKTPEDQARKTYERALKLEAEFAEYFTAIVSGETADDVYSRVKEVIYDHSGLVVWIPAREYH